MKSTKQVGYQTLFKLDVRFDPHGISNILSLAIMEKHYPVSFGIMENFFTVHLQGQEILFRKCEIGL